MWLYIFHTHRTPRVNPNVNYELWVTMMIQCRFVSCNQRPTLVGDVGDGVTGCVWEEGVHGKSL